MSTKAVAVAGREGRTVAAAFDEGCEFGFVGSAETIDKFRERSHIVARLERFKRERFRAAAPAIGFDRDAGKLLIEVADVDLPFFAENDSFHAVARHVVAANLDVRQQIFTEPETEQSIVEIFHTGGEGMAIDPRADG